jgi:hypothetical protein
VNLWKVRGPLTLAFIAGMLPIVSFFLNGGPLVAASDALEGWMIIIAGFALLLGVVNVTQLNIRKIQRRAPGWPNALALLLGLYIMATAGVLGAFHPRGFEGIGYRTDGSPTPFQWIAESMYIPLQSTMFALLAFYVASAAFRAFRARNLEASILLVSAVVVMMGRIPFGETIFAWIPGGREWLPVATEWIMDKPNAAGQRGIIIGAALGAASMSLRVILGIERSYLGLDKGN